jgi:hypothetical protein
MVDAVGAEHHRRDAAAFPDAVGNDACYHRCGVSAWQLPAIAPPINRNVMRCCSSGSFMRRLAAIVSPGISVNVTRNAQLFALVQLPVYQYMNGVQLTADWGATGGVGLRF